MAGWVVGKLMANFMLWNSISQLSIIAYLLLSQSQISSQERRIFYIPVVLIFPLDGLGGRLQSSDLSGKHHGVVERAFTLWWIQSPSWGWSLLAGQPCVHASLTPCDPVNHSLLGSSVHGVLQARILDWVAMPSSMGSSQPRDPTHIS